MGGYLGHTIPDVQGCGNGRRNAVLHTRDHRRANYHFVGEGTVLSGAGEEKDVIVEIAFEEDSASQLKIYFLSALAVTLIIMLLIGA